MALARKPNDKVKVDTLGIEPRASRMLSGCDTATPCAHSNIVLPQALIGSCPFVVCSPASGIIFSATGTRARVARVRAEYPDQLDYSGS